MPLTPIKISVFYYKHDGHIPQNFYYSDDIDEIWGLGENEYPGLTKALLSSKLFNHNTYKYNNKYFRFV